MKPKVLIINPDFYMYGGAERQITYLVNYLVNLGYHITILTKSMVQDMKDDLNHEVRIIECGDPQQLPMWTRAIANSFDIINPHNHPAELVCGLLTQPVVWQCNEPPLAVLKGGKLSKTEIDFVNENVDVGVVISDFEEKRFKSIYGFDPIKNYPGVRYEYFNKKGKPKDKYNLKDKFVLIEPGYVTFTKNQVGAVEILAEVKKKIKNAVLVFAGFDEDEYKLQVESKILELGLENSVIFTGYIEKDEDLRDLYYHSDVYIGPFESQGGWATTFEAAVCGLPVIVTPAFVASNLIKENSLGIVTEVKNFAQEIIKIAKNKKKIKPNADWIRDNLTWDNFGERYDKIFMEVFDEDRYSDDDD